MRQQPSLAVPERDRGFLWISSCILLIAAVPRLWAAFCDHGVFWPDEIFQSVEQAHRLVFGYGIVPWEFRSGARSWVFPGMVAALLKLGSLLGLDSGRSLVLLVKTSMALLSLFGLYLTMRLAYALAGRRATMLAGAFGAAFSVSLLLSSRCLSEMATAPVLVGSYLLTREGRAARLRLCGAGALAGLAICMRYQSGLVACGLLAILVLERRYTEAAWFAAGATALGLLGGLLDWFTWGSPFYAFKKYVYFNLKKSGDRFGRYPFHYYFSVAWTAVGPAVLVIASGFALGFRLAPKLALLALGYILIHSAIPHKEFRFVMPVVPFVLAIAGAGWAALLERMRAADMLALALGAVTAGAMAYRASQLTWESVGFPSDRGARSPWHSGEGINRLLWVAGERADVCGVMVLGESYGWIGGYTYFHRNVDLFPGTSDAERRAANYLIAPATEPALPGYRAVARERDAVLSRRDGECEAAPSGFRRELP